MSEKRQPHFAKKTSSLYNRKKPWRKLRKLTKPQEYKQPQVTLEWVKPPRETPLEGTVESLMVQWLAYKKHQIKANTLQTYQRAFVQFINPHLGHCPLEDLRALQVEDLVQTMLQKGASNHNAAYTLKVLRSALRQGQRWEVVNRNVAEYIKAPQVVHKTMQVWTPAEVQTFLQFARETRLYAMFYLALVTGMRKGELLGLRWQDVHWEKKELQVVQNLTLIRGSIHISTPKTRASKRTIALADDVLEVLRQHQQEQERELHSLKVRHEVEPVFASLEGSYLDPNNMTRTYRSLLEKSGVTRIRFHDLRHTAASLLIRQGVPAKLVSDRLGHTDVAFTLKVYTHLYDDQKHDAARPLETLMQKPASRKKAGPSTEGIYLLDDLSAALQNLQMEIREIRQLLHRIVKNTF